ncbi:hypothetical protein DPQ99_37380 [Burkholderia pseudomallei]|nr:hypothetical protein DPQ99_37380 [Burkholderia pseudomallei]
MPLFAARRRFPPSRAALPGVRAPAPAGAAAPRFAPRPLPISTEHCVGNRRQAAVPDDAKFVAR